MEAARSSRPASWRLPQLATVGLISLDLPGFRFIILPTANPGISPIMKPLLPGL